MGGALRKFGEKVMKTLRSDASHNDDIAVIGMACRFPGAKNYHEFWHNLIGGVNSIKEIPSSRWDIEKYYSTDIDAPNKSISKWCGLVDGIDKFDDRFFNISPREAKSMDPQQRLLLEETWHCIEDSGVALSHLQKKRTSVYMGVMAIDYYGEASSNGNTDSYACLGNYECIMANRLSYYLGFSGASLSLDAACAASLVALHEAKVSLRARETDFALAGGVSLNFHPFKYIAFSKSRMLSPDGQCRTFDAAANGYVPGDGVGVLLLQRLDDAIRDGNHVYGVVKGSAVNHTGPAISITAPRVESQRDVILSAYEDAGMSAETVSYLEAHGTGTSLGDPIEVEALTKAFDEFTTRRQYCGIGSVKTNIGHLEAAAGVASVIKVLLMMKHRRIPKTLNVTTLNPIINFEDSPFKVALTGSDWKPAGGSDLLRAGVSSFGFGGANAHTLLEEHREPLHKSGRMPKGGEPFIVSARTSHSLKGLISEWRRFLRDDENSSLSLRDICLTSVTGRESFAERMGCIVRNREDLAKFLEQDGGAVAAEPDKMVCIGVGEIALDGFSELKAFFEGNQLFRKHMDLLLSIMGENGVAEDALGAFRNKQWPKAYLSLFRFIAQYAYAMAFIEAGAEPDLIMAEGAGAWTGLALSGMVQLSDAVSHLGAGRDVASVELQRPRVPFYDSVNGRIIMPYRVDERYLHELIDDLDIEERNPAGRILVEEIAHSSGGVPAKGSTKLGQLLLKRGIITEDQLGKALREKEGSGQLLGAALVDKGYCTLRQIEESLAQQDLLRSCVDKARLLQTNQFTFKRYLKEWDEILGKYGRKVDDLLHNENLLACSGSEWSRERLLLLIIILSSLRKLNRKWNLTERVLVSDPRFYELLDLLLDNVLPKDCMAKIFLTERPDYSTCARTVEANQHLIDAQHAYGILKKHNTTLSEIDDVSSWIAGLEAANFASASADKYTRLYICGGHREKSAETGIVTGLNGDIAREFKEALVSLWLRGVAVAWDGIYPEGSFRKAALPTYAFQHKSFWLPKKEGAVEIDLSQPAPEQLPLPTPLKDDGSVHYLREFKPEDKIIQDHIITGKHLIPAASIIDLGFDAGSRALGRPIYTLHNIAVQHPGVVEETVALDVSTDTSKNGFAVFRDAVLMAMGKFDAGAFVPLPAIDLNSLKRGQPLPVDSIYSAFTRAGYRYGESLKVIKAAWKRGGTYLFELVDSAEEKSPYSKINPCMLDGLFQSVLAVEHLEGRSPSADTLHIPYLVALLGYDGVRRDKIYACVDIRDVKDKSGDILVSLGGYDSDGRCAVRIDNMVFKRTSNQFVVRGLMPAETATSHYTSEVYYYRPVWRRMDLEQEGAGADAGNRHALLVSDGGESAARMLERLKERYPVAFSVNRGDEFQLNGDSFIIDPYDEKDYSRLIGEVAGGSDGESTGLDLFYLWSGEAPVAISASNTGQKETERCIKPLLYLARALAKSHLSDGVRLVVCTREAQAIAPHDSSKGCICGALSGFLKTFILEAPHVRVKLVDFSDGDAFDTKNSLLIFREIESSAGFESIAYRDSQRYVENLERCTLSVDDRRPPWRDGGVYILSGGGGGIGVLVARAIAANARARIVIVDRSGLRDDRRGLVDEIKAMGSELEYYRADMTNLESMRYVIQRIKERWGSINGVIHAGGVIEDRLILNKDWESFERVLSPKVAGTIVLNEVTKEEPLDFFAVFSSIVSVTGNIGQADYAAANSFLDAFVNFRNKAGYPGKSFGINWTLWSGGGMGADSKTRAQFSKTSGVIDSARGVAALQEILNDGESRVIVAGRELPELPSKISPEAQRAAAAKGQAAKSGSAAGGSVEARLRDTLSEVLHVDRADLDLDTDLKEYGLDSVALTEFSEKIVSALNIDFNPSLLFEYNTIGSLTRYIAERMPVESAAVDKGADEGVRESGLQRIDEVQKAEGRGVEERGGIQAGAVEEGVKEFVVETRASGDIAIIGMAGLFPGSPDLDAFWTNLESGKDLIEEIPADRFDWRRYFGDPSREDNKMNCKWGGFIKDVDKFDASFFNISPREAELMDPQQRLMLEVTWRAVEDAGYAIKQFSDTKTGVFIGVCNDDYGELLESVGEDVEAYTSTGNYFSIIPNRISYIFNLRGPSIAVETACSSSLIAIHQAINAIHNNECEAAIAGGVNVLLTPKRFISFSKAGMLSPDGRCRTFDRKANGYVRGEGAGAILLKPLWKALSDGDHVYGVIKASAENHGGKANSLTAPNPVAQAELLEEAYGRAGIEPWHVSYIECHGTGTSLGDPVEVNGLKKAFEDMYRSRGKQFSGAAFCGLGTVKSNMGHLESAAGIAGVIKVLLSMEHGKLPEVVHFKELNPYIEISNSPFYIVNETREWRRLRDEDGREIPRTAGVSSFGFGGANAHVVIEEFRDSMHGEQRAAPVDQASEVIVLSARDRDGLRERVRLFVGHLDAVQSTGAGVGRADSDAMPLSGEICRIVAELLGVGEEEIDAEMTFADCGADEVQLAQLADAINDRYGVGITLDLFKTAGSAGALAAHLLDRHADRFSTYSAGHPSEPAIATASLNLRDAAFTLQVGREAMNERLATVVQSAEELRDKLKKYLDGDAQVEGLYSGSVKSGRGGEVLIGNDDEDRHYIRELFERRNLSKLAKLWVSGALIDWENLYCDCGRKPRRIPLPLYPFKRERYWVSEPSGDECRPRLHDLLDSNESTLGEQRYRKILSGNEYYLRDHVVAGERILPGVAYIEMARMAGDLAGEGSEVKRIKDVLWLQPLRAGVGKADVYISLYPGEGIVEYEVSSSGGNGSERVINSQGKLEYGIRADESLERVDIEAIRSRCARSRDKKSAYQLSASMGLRYGPAFQAIGELVYNDKEVLARLELPEGLKGNFGEYVLHPSIMDGALQSILSLAGDADDNRVYVPFSVGEVEIVRPITERCYAYGRMTEDGTAGVRKFDIDIVNDEGALLARMRDFAMREYSGRREGPSKQVDSLTYMSESWIESPLETVRENVTGSIILLGGDEELRSAILEKQGGECRVLHVKNGDGCKRLDDGSYEVRAGCEADYQHMLEVLAGEGIHPDKIICLFDRFEFVRGEADVGAAMEECVYSVFGLTRALMAAKQDGDVKILCAYRGDEINPYIGGLSGFARSTHLENSKFSYRVMSAGADVSSDELAGIMLDEFGGWDAKDVEVKYDGGRRYKRTLEEVEPGSGGPGIKQGGVYLITGGIGGLGAIFARHLSSAYKAKLVLSDVRALDGRGEALLEEIARLGGEALYVRCDVTSRKDVRRLVGQAREKFGRLDGIIHAAGAIRDSFIVKKKREEMELVLNAKIRSAINLDAETVEDDLDFFVAFASIAGVIGNVGQSDYAYANRFLDKFSEWRENLRARGERRGGTFSIEWPLWAEGGMAVGDETKRWLKQTLGIEVLPTENGIRAFEAVVHGSRNQALVVYGDSRKMRELVGAAMEEKAAAGKMISETVGREISALLFDKIRNDVVKIVAGIVKVDEGDVDVDAQMSEYGFDSITITELTNKINSRYEINLTPATFFEHNSIASMVRYLLEERRSAISDYYRLDGNTGGRIQPHIMAYAPEAPVPARSRFRRADGAAVGEVPSLDPIAVVGMSGVFPESSDLDEFWRHLEACDDLIAEIPPDRWDWREYYGDPQSEGNRTKSKWGGFMKEVDKFDASFFNISPHEAELMDPQQRIFLEVTWKTIENAGYSPSALSGSRTGLFVGVSTSNYYELLQQNGVDVEAHTSTGTMHSVLPNRISYLLNLRGPSEPIDTACSSSLIAIHRAVRAIQDGDCDMAIAGGVGVILTPTLHISFGKAGMLSDDGRCKTFDKAANGYVRGEGAGAVLLKPLSRALRDGDHIYGVIRATAENHGGHVSSLTVPNPVAQAELLVDAYSRAGVKPWRVGYIECHGTGTSLGDPVEVNGLKRAFSDLFRKFGGTFNGDAYCGLGTVKTNIGHLEAAAGIAGFIKVLLSIQHAELPGVVNFKELNPFIEISGSPFYIVEKTQEWRRLQYKNGKELPRIAGVSSFGFGGANAHVIVEEYVDKKRAPQRADAVELSQEILVLSARNHDRLRAYVEELLAYLKSGEISQNRILLRDMAYTLQAGRGAMEERLAVVVNNFDELREKLAKYLGGEGNIDGLHSGNAKAVKDRDGVIGEGEEEREFVRNLIKKRNLHKIAALWASGSSIDWDMLYRDGGDLPHRIALPAYPFKRERHWIPESSDASALRTKMGRLHELLDSNESTLEEQRYRKLLTGSEYYLRDHVVGGDKVLPGVAYIEMARLAGDLAEEGSRVTRIKDVLWLQPLRVGGGKAEVYVNLYPGEGLVEYEVSSTSGNGSERVINSQGRLEYGITSDESPERMDIEAIRSRCTQGRDKQSAYRLSASMGLHYGPSFQAITWLIYNGEEVLARLELPDGLKGSFGEYVLHPSLMDGALQSILSLVGDAGDKKIYVPFSMGEVEIVGPLADKCYAYARSTDKGFGGMRKFDIDIISDDGVLLARLRRFVVREYSGEMARPAQKTENLACLSESWTESRLGKGREPVSGAIIIMGSNDELRSTIQVKFGDGCRVLQIRNGEGYKRLDDSTYEVRAGCEADYQNAVEELAREGVHVDRIIYLFDRLGFVGGDGDVAAAMDASVYSVFGLTRALMAAKQGGDVKILCAYRGDEINPYVGGLSGFGRSAHLENSKFSYRVVSADANVSSDDLAGMMLDEFGGWDAKDVEVKYDSGRRYKRTLEEVEPGSGGRGLKQGGVYLITGGIGGLGAIFARHLSSAYKAKLVLSDVRNLDGRGEALLEEIAKLGGEAFYVRCDVTNREEVNGLAGQAKDRFGRIDGIIHAAGTIRDSFIVKKKREEMELVLNAKIKGAINLDAATAGDDLDLFVTFASIAGVMGNIGQCDYAYANRFLDNFAQRREGLRERGERRGRTLSIDWPLWAEGGMMVDEEVKKRLKDKFGMNLLATVNGIAMFEAAVNSRSGNVAILEGDIEKIKKHLEIFASKQPSDASGSPENREEAAGTSESEQSLKLRVENDLTRLCVELLGVPSENIDPEVDFSEYGVDSIMMIKMLNAVEAMYGKTVDPNSIAMNPSVRQFALYLISEGIVESSATSAGVAAQSVAQVEPARPAEIIRRSDNKRARFTGRASPEKYHKIAVIGMACRFPGSQSVEAFWQHLHDKDELITEVPKDRWNVERYFSAERNVPGKSYSKWGGFIRDIDAFDAGFFGIADADALTMDPQQRIMLELTQELLDRSGYARNEMDGSKTAVYIGAASNQYIHDNLSKLTYDEMKHMVVNNIPNMIAARVSDYFNLRGPSQTIDTACSSSLVALNEACRSIRTGESDAAIVGGIMLMIDPYFHVGFGKAEVLSSDGKSYVFDQRANGFVLGEGAGLVLLKPYERALEDGDRILGVILGSAVNNDGHTMGVTVPNPEGQKDVILTAIKESGVSPATISYLEAHGTGTLLGDPIEIKAATQVYREYTKELQYCAVGSVKSNIGHLLTAAGVASLIKVLLSLQHKSLLPTLNCENPHPRFRFPETPFYPITEGMAWEPRGGVRRAAISSFGFGGTNCHVILEEFKCEDDFRYQEKRTPLPMTRFHRKRYWLGKKIESAGLNDEAQLEESFVADLIADVQKGKISPQRAKELIDM